MPSLIDQKRTIIQTTFALTDAVVAKLSIQDLMHIYWSGNFPVAHPYDGSESGLNVDRFSTMDHFTAVEKKKAAGDLDVIRSIV